MTPLSKRWSRGLGGCCSAPGDAAAIVTDRGFGRVLDFAEHHAAGDEFALVMEFARTLQGERRARLARALLQSGEELYDSPDSPSCSPPRATGAPAKGGARAL